MISADEALKITRPKFESHIKSIERLIIESAKNGETQAQYKQINVFDVKTVERVISDLKIAGFKAELIIASTMLGCFTGSSDFIRIDWSKGK